MSLRSDFETASLFGAPYCGASAFVKKADGTYVNQKVEAAFQGYEIGRRGAEGRLARFSPDRSIQNGHLHEINEKAKLAGIERPITAEMVRLVLGTVKGWPV